MHRALRPHAWGSCMVVAATHAIHAILRFTKSLVPSKFPKYFKLNQPVYIIPKSQRLIISYSNMKYSTTIYRRITNPFEKAHLIFWAQLRYSMIMCMDASKILTESDLFVLFNFSPALLNYFPQTNGIISIFNLIHLNFQKSNLVPREHFNEL